ncbi:phosphatase PAP2 family protein [Lewinella sp. 4G2]|uniref:phosphatase PAP2 family protein n=1 Tax=Lewinella sp. 4G2 TaxID=1803372 RepID=UPI0007B4A71E|nr:phosphatase PAP2 family protein [Lewinella sp. 4G2]OAV46256.1 hypothetical protein A3850_018545 [Lewinella sp. 4G2]
MPSRTEELRPVIKRDDRLLLKVVIGLFLTYAILAIIVVSAGLDRWTTLDRTFTLALQRASSPTMDAIMEFISWWASVPGACIVILGMGLLFALRKRWVEVGFMFLPLLVVPIVSVVKRLFNRARPTADTVRVIRDFNHESFPSGHVVFYVVLFGLVTYLLYRHWRISNWLRFPIIAFSIFLIATVPFSRMYLGAHWFTDVTAGFVLGAMLLIGLVVWYNRVLRNRNKGAAAGAV